MQSILSRDMVTLLLRAAKLNLAVDGRLASVLFVQLTNGEQLASEVNLPNAHEDKRFVFSNVRKSLERDGKMIEEALLLSEGWFVNAQTSPAAFSLPPSRHPQRAEAITLVGRDAKKTRSTFVIQPFTRNRNREPVWGTVSFEIYNEPIDRGHSFSGIIDDLFEEAG